MQFTVHFACVGAHAVTLPWLPVLAHCLAASGEEDEADLPELLPAFVQTLWLPSHSGALSTTYTACLCVKVFCLQPDTVCVMLPK